MDANTERLVIALLLAGGKEAVEILCEHWQDSFNFELRTGPVSECGGQTFRLEKKAERRK